MVKRRKFPLIRPQLVEDAKGKVVAIMLDYEVYEAILKKIDELKKRIAELKKSSKAI